jgi:hypothetical protein
MSQYRNQENQGDFVPHGDNKGMNPFERFKDNSDFIRIYDLFEPVRHTNRDVYEITERVLTIFNSILKIYEERNLRINHFELFELVYKIVEQTIYEIQRTKYNSIDDLLVFNLNTLSLFLEPNNVTEEELKYSEKLIDKEYDGYEVEIKLPENSQRNYFINVKRILDENNSNPYFNETILNFFDRNRDTN